MHRPRRFVLLLLLCCVLSDPGRGQSLAPIPSCQVDDRVEELAAADGLFYAVGRFQRARPASAAPGDPGEVVRTGALAFDAATGALASWAPTIQHGRFPVRVDCIAIHPDAEVIFVGGVFDSVNGQPRSNVAAVDRQGQLLAWRASQLGVGRVRDLELSSQGDRLFVAGDQGIEVYGTSMGVQRPDPRFAVRIADAQGQPSPIWALELCPEDQVLYFGGDGSMAAVHGVPRSGVAAVDAASGALREFAPELRDSNPGDPRVQVWEILHREGAVHVFGDWWQTRINGQWVGGQVQQRNYGRFDPTTGRADPSFVTWCDGGVQTGRVDAISGQVVFGGHFDHLGGPADAPSTAPWRPDLGAIDFDGSDRSEPWRPIMRVGSGSAGSEVFALELAAGRLAVGGAFLSAGGVNQQNLALFEMSDRQALFVVADPARLGTLERRVANRLERVLGFAVALHDDDLGDGSEAAGMDLVVVSSSASASVLGPRYRSTSAPVLTWNAAMLAELGLTGRVPGVDHGVEYLDRIELPQSHPLAGRFDDAREPLFQKAVPVLWGRPVPAAEVAAVTPGGGMPCWFVLHGGAATLSGQAAAGTRIALPVRGDDGRTAPLFASGFEAMFDASVRYAIDQAGAAAQRITGSCARRLQPQLRIGRVPRVGRDIDVEILGGPPGAMVALVVDGSGTLPQPVVAGCELIVDVSQAVLLPATLDAAGDAAWSLPVGSGVHQLYRPFAVQAVISDAGGPLMNAYSLSDGFRIVVQP